MAKIIGAPTLDDALAALRKQVEGFEARGEQTVIFCEDRLTLLSERAVLASLSGTFSTEVTTFARFLSGPRVLSKQGSVMKISSLIAENEEKLHCFGRSAAPSVYETIAQLSASRVDGEALARAAEGTEGTLRGKLLDLELLSSLYRDWLDQSGLLDESGYLSLLPEKMASIADKNVIFFGFRSFTKQALEGVRAALSGARSATGIFLAGREVYYTNEAARLFRRAAEELGCAEPSMVRSSLGGEALVLSRGLFSPEKYTEPPVRTDSVFRFSASDEAEEMKTIAALVKKHVSEGARYRDIAVLVPDAESFLTVEKAFSAYKIPFFADRTRPFSEHPFCAFVLAALAAVHSGPLPEDADAVASSWYFGNGDNYRNYLLKYGGYRGAVRREIKEGDAVKGYSRPELVACREKMLKILSLFPRKGKGSAFTEGVRALRELVSEEEKTEELSAWFSGAEREFLDLSPLEGVLSEIGSIAGEKTFEAREFSDALKSGMDALGIAMIPQFEDAVFVGDATESKFERVKILFAAGLTEALPRVSPDTAVITDGEMGKLSGLKVEIEPAIAVVNARAREGLALNLCSFTERLYLSYPVKKKGAETERSEVLEYAERLFEMPAMPELFPYDCSEPQPAALRLLSLKEGFEARRERDGKRYSALFSLLGKDAESLMGAEEKPAVPAAAQLYRSGTMSPTLLEGYFDCPYRGFVSRGLKLREREERTVLDTDTGTFLHIVLEKCAARFNDTEREEDCRALAEETARSLLSSRFAALSDTEAGAYAAGRIIAEAAEVTVAAWRQLRGSGFRVEKTEGNVDLPRLALSGKTDRVDGSGSYVRVIDYKTGVIDDTVAAYYTGRKLQLELYLKAASEGRTPAGAFYFPAAESFTGEGEAKYRMSGFYSGEEEVLSRMDVSLGKGEKSEFFDGKRDGKYTDRGMKQEDFSDFLEYGVLVAEGAEREMAAGNVSPSPYEKVCDFCKLRGMCGFVGEARKEPNMKCSEVVRIVRKEREERK